MTCFVRFAFKEISKRQEEIAKERDQMEKEKKQLVKQKPPPSSSSQNNSDHSSTKANSEKVNVLKNDGVWANSIVSKCCWCW